MSDTTELDDLDGVTQHPGWHRIKAMLAAEWGPTGTRYVQTLEKLANNDDSVRAAANLQQVIWVRKEIESFIAGVEGRARRLREMATQAVNPSRRGTL